MSKKIDPTERALNAYSELDTDQRATFHAVLKHSERLAAMLGNSGVDCFKPQPAPTRGRPKGSKNRKADTPTAQELDLRHNNGAAAEGL